MWRHPSTVRAAYARAIAYSVDTLVSFVEWVDDDDRVLVMLGDHQPASVVSGSGASHMCPSRSSPATQP